MKRLLLIGLLLVLSLQIVSAQVNYQDGLQVLWQDWTTPTTPDMSLNDNPAGNLGTYSLVTNIVDASQSGIYTNAGSVSDTWRSVSPVYYPIEDGFTISYLYNFINEGLSYSDIIGYGTPLGSYSSSFPADGIIWVRKNLNNENNILATVRLNSQVCTASFTGANFYLGGNHLLIVSYNATSGLLACEHNGASCGSTVCTGGTVNVTSKYLGQGGISQGGAKVDGYSYQFAMWDRPLSTDEKAGLYNSGSYLALEEYQPNLEDGLYMLYQNWSVPVNSQDMTYHNYPDIFSSGGAYSSTTHVLDPDWNALQGGVSFTSQIWYVEDPVYIPIENGFTVGLLWDPTDDGGTATDVVGYGPHIGTYAPQFPADASFLIRRRRLPSGEIWNTGQELEAFLRLEDGVCSGLFTFPSDYFGYPISLDVFSYSTDTGNFTCLRNNVSCGTISCSGATVNVSASNYIGMGGIAQGGGLASGKYYQFAVWNRELDNFEKEELYNSGSYLALNETYAPYDGTNWVRENITSSATDYYEHYFWNNPLYASHGRIHDVDNDGLNDIFLVSQDYGMIYFKNINNTWPVPDDPIVIDATYTSIDEASIELGYDINDDTCEDIVFIGPNSQPPRWLEGHCNGTYDSVRTLPNSFDGPFTEYFDALGVGDIDDDGDIDIFSDTSIDSVRYIFWWENDGLGNFTQYNIKNITSIPHSIRVVDWNADTIQDVVVGGHDFVCHFLTNDGNEVFTTTTQSDCGQIITFEDINEDLYPDIIAIQSTSGTVWQENVGGTGTWTEHIVNDNTGAYGAVAVAKDVSFDNELDIFSTDGTYRVVHSTKNGGTWDGPYEMLKPNNWDFYNEWGGQFYDLDFGDINNDGVEELLAAGEFPFIFFNNNTIPGDYFCEPDWSCTSYAACQIDDTRTCIAVEDLNTCGVSYTGNYSEFPPASCDYCTPNIVGCSLFGNCTTSDVLPCLELNDTNTCYNITGLPSDNPDPSTENGVCDYCTPSLGWDYTNWTYASCGPANVDAEYRTGEYNDLNSCYSQTSLPSDATGIEYCEGVPSCEDINHNVCNTLGPGKPGCCAAWGCTMNPSSWLCEGTSTLPDCPESGCFSYSVDEFLQLSENTVEGCYYNSNIAIEYNHLSEPCDFCTPNLITPLFNNKTTIDIRYAQDGDWVYPSHAYCGDDGYQYQWVQDVNYDQCCGATGLAEDCFQGRAIPDEPEGIYLAGNRTCEDVFYLNQDFNIGYVYTHGEIRGDPLIRTASEWYACEDGSVFNPGVLQMQVGRDVSYGEWYLCTHGGAYAGSNRLEGQNGGMSFWLRSTSLTGATRVWHKPFDLTNNTRINMDVWRADDTHAYLSFQNESDKGGFIIPINARDFQDPCANAGWVGGEPGNVNEIVCCDAFASQRATSAWHMNTTVQQLQDACPTLTDSHIQNLRMVSVKVRDNGGSFGNSIVTVDKIVITPYDDFEPVYSSPPNITGISAVLTDTGVPLSIINNTLQTIPTNTNVTITISATDGGLGGGGAPSYLGGGLGYSSASATTTPGGDGDAILYYQINCGGSCSCVPTDPYVSPLYGSMNGFNYILMDCCPETGIISYYPNIVNSFQCIWTADGPRNITIEVSDNGEITRSQIWGNSGPGMGTTRIISGTSTIEGQAFPGQDTEILATTIYAGPACGDLVCDEGAGENYITCPSDCDSYCGDDICDVPGGENYQTCGTDCNTFCGDLVCDGNLENPSTCPSDCVEGGTGGSQPKEDDLDFTCNPGVEFEQGETQIITEYADLETPYFLREIVSGETCGIDADQDGIMCDLSEDFISCPTDCNFNVAELFCVHTQRCMWTESWFLQLIIILQMMVALYMIYIAYLE